MFLDSNKKSIENRKRCKYCGGKLVCSDTSFEFSLSKQRYVISSKKFRVPVGERYSFTVNKSSKNYVKKVQTSFPVMFFTFFCTKCNYSNDHEYACDDLRVAMR